ncbi:MAG: hypothetical protein ISS26_01000 [Candidatus Omnitrophica bacterium]|nr:hypothetical protein [Candidatus Omnitrophota bacterium]
MGLYYIFTVDGDWDEYFSTELPRRKRRPDRKNLLSLIKREIKIACSIGGKILHFVHTSPVTRQYFLQPDFVELWKEIERRGGSIGIHCHEEDLFSHGRLNDAEKLEQSIRSITYPLRDKGLNLISYRGGYLTFCKTIIPILERNEIALDFSCSPGRYLHYKGRVIADWRRAPKNYYRMCYRDHRKEGKSDIVEIPPGKLKRRALYIDITSLLDIWMVARRLARKERVIGGNIIVSLLTHTYEFSSLWKRLKIRAALFICNRYGSFISDKEALDFIRNEEGTEKYEDRNRKREQGAGKKSHYTAPRDKKDR